MLSLNDNELLERIAAGNHSAFNTLVKRHVNSFYKLAYRYTCDRTFAEDIVQQAFLKLWEYPHKYDPDKGASFTTWFYQVIVNMCIDFKRKNRPMLDISEIDVEANNISATDEICRKQKQDMLEHAIHKLPIRQQTALNLGIYQDISYEDVAKIMKTTTSSVKSLIMRAKDNIRKMLKGEDYA